MTSLIEFRKLRRTRWNDFWQGWIKVAGSSLA